VPCVCTFFVDLVKHLPSPTPNQKRP
jgi:hypothetical protein